MTAFDPSGRWAIACQIREDTDRDGRITVEEPRPHGLLSLGDRWALFFMKRAGPEGERIERYIDHSPSGRYVSYASRGDVVAFDVEREQYLNFAVPPEGNVREIRFSSDDRMLVYIRQVGESDTVVLRSLVDDSERSFDFGTTRIWRAAFVGTGSWLGVATVPDDSDSSGEIELPSLPETSRSLCHPPPAFPESPDVYDGDDWVVRYFDARNMREETRDVVHVGGPGLLVLDEDSATYEWRSAFRRPLPTGCFPKAIDVVDPPRILMSCPTESDGVRSLRLLGPPGERHLANIQERLSTEPPSFGRFWAGARVFDLRTGHSFPNPEGGWMVTDADQGQVWELEADGSLQERDVDRGSVRRILGPTSTAMGMTRFGKHAVITRGAHLVVRLADAHIVGALPTFPVLIDDEGCSLLPVTEASANTPAQGPLYWATPTHPRFGR